VENDMHLIKKSIENFSNYFVSKSHISITYKNHYSQENRRCLIIRTEYWISYLKMHSTEIVLCQINKFLGVEMKDAPVIKNKHRGSDTGADAEETEIQSF
jgi:hypothetical protein